MPIKIYKKNDTSFETITLNESTDMASHVPFVGVCVTPSGEGTHYLFDIINGELRRYQMRMMPGNTSIFPYYQNFSDTEKAFLTTSKQHPQGLPRPSIPEGSQYFSREELISLAANIRSAELLTETEKAQCPYLPGSPLSNKQQEMLYRGAIDVSGYSFFDYLEFNQLSERVLQASIGATVNPPLDLDENTELRAFRFIFFSPNQIQTNFPKSLYEGQAYHPTVGDILDFYTHCVQKELEKSGQAVLPEQVRRYTAATRSINLGDPRSHDFGNEGIYNPQGLTDQNDVIFRFIIRLFELQHEFVTDNVIEEMLAKPELANLYGDLYGVLNNIVHSTETDQPTSHDAYKEIYDSIIAVYPKEGWRNFLEPIRLTQKSLIQKVPAQDIIMQDKQLTLEQKYLILNTLALTADKRLSGEFLDAIKKLASIPLLLTAENILVTNILTLENINAVVEYRYSHNSLFHGLETLSNANILTQNNFNILIFNSKPNIVAITLRILHEANIILTPENQHAITTLDPNYFFGIITTLQDTNILTQTNMDKIIVYVQPLKCICDSLFRLENAGIVTQNNFDAIVTHINLKDVENAITTLSDAHLLSQANFDSIIAHSDVSKITIALSKLHSTHFLSQATFDVIMGYEEPQHIASVLTAFQNEGILTEFFQALTALGDAHILTQANFNIIVKYMRDVDSDLLTKQSLQNIFLALSKLRSSNILMQNNFNTITKYQYPLNDAIAKATVMLHDANVLTQDNFNVISKNIRNATSNLSAEQSLQHVIKTVVMLSNAGILTPENRDAITTRRKPRDIFNAVTILRDTGIAVTQINFDAILAHGDFVLEKFQNSHILTQANFNMFMTHRDPDNLLINLAMLNDAEILTQNNFDMLAARQNQQTFCSALEKLKNASLLDPINFNVIIAYQNPTDVTQTLITLKNDGILTPKFTEKLRTAGDSGQLEAESNTNTNQTRHSSLKDIQNFTVLYKILHMICSHPFILAPGSGEKRDNFTLSRSAAAVYDILIRELRTVTTKSAISNDEFLEIKNQIDGILKSKIPATESRNAASKFFSTRDDSTIALYRNIVRRLDDNAMTGGARLTGATGGATRAFRTF